MTDQDSAAVQTGLQLETVMPAMTVNDMQASLTWYRDVMGFTVVREMANDDGTLRFAMLAAGNVQVMIGQDDFAKGRDRPKGVAFRFHCVAKEDVDAIAEGIKARGGTLLQEPTDQPWGSRDFSVEDPDGFKFTITSPPTG